MCKECGYAYYVKPVSNTASKGKKGTMSITDVLVRMLIDLEENEYVIISRFVWRRKPFYGVSFG